MEWHDVLCNDTPAFLSIGKNGEIQGMDKFLENPMEPFDYEGLFLLTLEHLKSMASEEAYPKLPKESKDSEESLMWRKAGNEIFLSCDDNLDSLLRALEYYTRCVAFAPVESEELALGYSNRSAVLIKLNRIEDCLEDINRAFELPYPQKIKTKLLIRRAECFAKLEEAKEKLNSNVLRDANGNVLKNESNVTLTKEKFICEDTVIPEIPSPNKKFPCASDAIDVDFSKRFGRHVVATRDINVGEVLIVEKPYSMFLKPENNYTHCHYCMTLMWAGIPCEKCVKAVYCTEECRSMAWGRYHQFECLIVDFKEECGLISNEMLCSRLLYEAFYAAGGLEQLKQRVKASKSYLDNRVWPLNFEWYKDSSLESFLALETNINKVPKNLIRETALISVRCTYIKACATSLLGVQYDWNEMSDWLVLDLMSKNPDFIFVGGLFMKMFLIVQSNYHEFNEYDTVMEKRMRGLAFLPFMSLTNISCFPNAYRQCKKDRIVLYATYPIKKGEQVFDNFGHHVLCAPRERRQKDIKSMFYFTCFCDACSEKWPPYDPSVPVQILLKPGETVLDVKNNLEEVKKVWSKSGRISEKVKSHDLMDKDKMLGELYKHLQLVYEKVDLPCTITFGIVQAIEMIFNMTGSLTMSRYLQAHSQQ